MVPRHGRGHEEEVAYNAVDDDCDGADLTDADGDGHDALAAGGADCDDTLADINPTATESWANGFTDDDCDGDNGSAILEFGGDVWAGGRAGDLQGRRTAALGDPDENGLQDVLVGSELDSTLGDASGAIYALDGAPGGSLEVARSLLPDVAGMNFASDVDAGVDVTGDAVPDVLVSMVGSAEVAGTAWIIDGAAWVVAGDTTVTAVEVARVSGSAGGTYGPTSVKFVGDVTGDGVTDIALSECCGTSTGPSSSGRVALFSADRFGGSIEDADVLIDGPFDFAYMGGEMDAVGDQDGDGRDDVAILGEDEAGLIYLFTAVGGAPTRALDFPSCVFDWSEHGGVADVVPLGDRDGDGRDELFIPQYYSDSGNQRAWVLPGAAVSFGGTVEAEASSLSGVSVVPGAAFGYSAALAGDVDGDGADDIVVGAPEYSAAATNGGGATLITVPR